MKNTQHVLISLEERHANNIIGGTKKVELRRRTMHIEPGAVVWFYVKKPIGAVVGYAIVGPTYSAAPSTVWRKFGSVSGLKSAEFFSYFDGVAKASAMGVSNPQRLKISITLAELRALDSGFHPPQFYCRIETGSPIQLALSTRSES